MNLLKNGMRCLAVIASFLVYSSVCEPNTRDCVTREIQYHNYYETACGFGWYYFKNKCYFIKESEFYTYDEAETLCQGMDSQLVTIKDADLDLFLREFGNRTSLWTGLTDRDVEGAFRWADDSVITYSNWNVHQPDNGAGIEDCVQLRRQYGGNWNDQPCETKCGFVCQKGLYIMSQF
ncbi:perlucin-like [Glandiceps talaboti]